MIVRKTIPWHRSMNNVKQCSSIREVEEIFLGVNTNLATKLSTEAIHQDTFSIYLLLVYRVHTILFDVTWIIVLFFSTLRSKKDLYIIEFCYWLKCNLFSFRMCLYFIRYVDILPVWYKMCVPCCWKMDITGINNEQNTYKIT